MHTNPERVPEVLRKILSTPDLRASVLEKMAPIKQWLEDQTAFAFYGSSLLLACDENEARDCKVSKGVQWELLFYILLPYHFGFEEMGKQ